LPNLVGLILEINESIMRRFQADYLVFDAIFLAVWIVLLVRHKRYRPLVAGLVCGFLFYLIDGVIWVSTGVRNYELPAHWVRFPVDFMMDVSYGIVAFSWAWIAFERKSVRDVTFWTALLFGGWLAIPFASRWIPLIDAPVMTVRDMSSRVWLHITAVVVGYALLFFLGYDWKTVLYVFCVGCMLAFMMEFSLLVAGIRSFNIALLVYETLILTNMGVPYFFIIKDKLVPLLGRRAPAEGVA
jgi:hypothetical protein